MLVNTASSAQFVCGLELDTPSILEDAEDLQSLLHDFWTDMVTR